MKEETIKEELKQLMQRIQNINTRNGIVEDGIIKSIEILELKFPISGKSLEADNTIEGLRFMLDMVKSKPLGNEARFLNKS